MVLEFRADSFEHGLEVERVQIGLSVLYGKGVLAVPYNDFDELDDRLVCFGGELDVVSIEFVVEFVICTIVFGFF